MSKHKIYTEGFKALQEEVKRLRLGLGNCLMWAMRQRRRHRIGKARPGELNGEDWDHIIRFCKEAGVAPSPLREGEEQGR